MLPTQRRRLTSGMRRWLVALPLIGTLLISSCRNVRVSSEVQAQGRPLDFETYAWLDPVDAEGSLEADIQNAIESRLAARGLKLVDEWEAELLVDFDTSVEKRTRSNDPYFAYYAVEEFEVGTLTIDFLDAATRETIWSGSGESRLRLTGVLSGPFATELTPKNEQRDWSVDSKVAAILARLN